MTLESFQKGNEINDLMGKYPRIVIAGISGDSGKTLVSCGIIAALKNRNYPVAAFKKGPDYIDAAWLSLASGTKTRNLDVYLAGPEKVREAFFNNSEENKISLIEGNRGLFDGFDAQGSFSTAELAKLLNAPVIIVLPVIKQTRTAAAIILGLKNLDPELNIAGIILNQVAGKRHENIVRESIEAETGIPVLGAIPKLENFDLLPSRHLGLITPAEHVFAIKAIDTAGEIINAHIDLDKIIDIAEKAPTLDNEFQRKPINSRKADIRIGYFEDRVFSFYYPENLEALEAEGAELVRISSIEDNELPDVDGLYIGGGFPETNIEELSSNKQMMEALKAAADAGLPIYAECGGLIYLSESIEINNTIYTLSGVLPIKLKMEEKPQGHGYVEAVADKENPFYPVGTKIREHEFHYTRIIDFDTGLKCCLSLKRGTGSVNKRDGFIYKNTFAGYMHIHADGCPEWAEGFVKLIRERKLNQIL